MAMRPAVRNRSIMLIVFSVVQWLFMRYILANNLFNLDTNDRIVGLRRHERQKFENRRGSVHPRLNG